MTVMTETDYWNDQLAKRYQFIDGSILGTPLVIQ